MKLICSFLHCYLTSQLLIGHFFNAISGLSFQSSLGRRGWAPTPWVTWVPVNPSPIDRLYRVPQIIYCTTLFWPFSFFYFTILSFLVRSIIVLIMCIPSLITDIPPSDLINAIIELGCFLLYVLISLDCAKSYFDSVCKWCATWKCFFQHDPGYSGNWNIGSGYLFNKVSYCNQNFLYLLHFLQGMH